MRHAPAGDLHGPVNLEFAAYLPFYAYCSFRLTDDDRMTDRPIRIFHGAADDYVPVATCREYAERLGRAGADVRLTVYPGAYHMFDNPDLAPVFIRELQNPARCFIEERPGGVLVNRDTGRPPDWNDACASRGATVGYNAAAHRRAIEQVREFLSGALKPPR